MRSLDRITRRAGVMNGEPCIRGMRVTVGMIVGAVNDGRTVNELLADFPYLEREDIAQALAFALANDETGAVPVSVDDASFERLVRIGIAAADAGDMLSAEEVEAEAAAWRAAIRKAANRNPQ